MTMIGLTGNVKLFAMTGYNNSIPQILLLPTPHGKRQALQAWLQRQGARHELIFDVAQALVFRIAA
jgi:hypothetical protein